MFLGAMWGQSIVRRLGTSRNIHHSTDSLHDSLDATMQIERLIAQHGRVWVEGLLMAVGRRTGNREQVKALVGDCQPAAK